MAMPATLLLHIQNDQIKSDIYRAEADSDLLRSTPYTAATAW